MKFLRREPVRAAVYSVAVAVLALLVSLGVVDDATSGAIAAVVSAVLAVATEIARANVTPTPHTRPRNEGGYLDLSSGYDRVSPRWRYLDQNIDRAVSRGTRRGGEQ